MHIILSYFQCDSSPLFFSCEFIFHVLNSNSSLRVRSQEIINLFKNSVCKQADKQNVDTFFVLAARLSSVTKKKRDSFRRDHFSRNFTCIYATATSLYFFLSTRVGIIILLLVPTIYFTFLCMPRKVNQAMSRELHAVRVKLN